MKTFQTKLSLDCIFKTASGKARNGLSAGPGAADQNALHGEVSTGYTFV